MNRRSFLGTLFAIGATSASLKLKAGQATLSPLVAPPVSKKTKFDDNTVVFISDLHTNPNGYQPERLVRVVNDILKMKPLPRNVIALGDLAYLTGKISEYELCKKIIKPLEDAGIQVTLGMGNHDRRANFAKVFPEHAISSPLKDRQVHVVDTPKAAFIVLDSLQEGDNETKWITPGAIDDNQRKWLVKTLEQFKKPVFVCAHHPIAETKLKEELLSSTCVGYINGHDHVWRPEWFKKNYSSMRLIPTLCLPSTGHWGDIGYMVLNLKEDHAEALLKQYEFFFPKPIENAAERPAEWDYINNDHQGLKYRFSYIIK